VPDGTPYIWNASWPVLPAVEIKMPETRMALVELHRQRKLGHES
jgi:hypothetical protein